MVIRMGFKEEIRERIKKITELDRRAKEYMFKFIESQDDGVRTKLHKTLLELSKEASVEEYVEPLLKKGFETVSDVRPEFLDKVALLGIPLVDTDASIVGEARSYNELLLALHRLALRKNVERLILRGSSTTFSYTELRKMMMEISKELIKEAPEDWRRAIERFLEKRIDIFAFPIALYDPAEKTLHIITRDFGDVHGAHIEINTVSGRIHIETPLFNIEIFRRIAKNLGWEVVSTSREGGFRIKKYIKNPPEAFRHIERVAEELSKVAR